MIYFFQGYFTFLKRAFSDIPSFKHTELNRYTSCSYSFTKRPFFNYKRVLAANHL